MERKLPKIIIEKPKQFSKEAKLDLSDVARYRLREITPSYSKPL
jgi:hypothetical protein